MKQQLQELLVLVIGLAIAVGSALLSRFKLSKKNNKMLKIIDTLIMIAELTGISGDDKKAFVIKAFEDFKLGKIDNIEEYIDDKIKLSNTINVKQSLVNQVISEELAIQKYYQDIEDVIVDTNVKGHDGPLGFDTREDTVKMVQLERENDELKRKFDMVYGERTLLKDERDNLRGELFTSNSEVARLKEVEQHLASKVNLCNHQIRDLENTIERRDEEIKNLTNMLKMREEQLNKLRGE